MESIVHAGMVFLEVLFFTGWIGSLVVVIISGIEDMETIFQKDVAEPATAIGGDHDLS
jgi:hypothetical protein